MLQTLSEVVESTRKEGNCGELEIRVGTVCSDGAFIAGMDPAEFQQLHREMEEDGSLEAEDADWKQVIDYHYVANTGEQVRTRVECDLQGLTMNTEHITKTAVCSKIIAVEDGKGVACRVVCSRETPIPTPPKSCFPTHVRVKSRRRFFDRRNDHVVWSYELSQTWSGPSRLVVESKQKNDPPVCEVECELVDGAGKYMREHDNEFVSESLVLKAKALLGTTCPLFLKGPKTLRGPLTKRTPP